MSTKSKRSGGSLSRKAEVTRLRNYQDEAGLALQLFSLNKHLAGKAAQSQCILYHIALMCHNCQHVVHFPFL